MVLLTSIIIFAGVFASWTVTVRSQEFYALLLALVTGVYGVFVSLDLFVFFLFYELAVLPDVSADRHLGLDAARCGPRGIFALGVSRDRRGDQRVRGDEAHPLPPVRLGVHPGRHLRPLRQGRAAASFSFLELRGDQRSRPRSQRWVFLAFYVGFGVLAGIWPLHTWSPDGHASAPTAVSMLHAGVLMKLGAYGVVRLGMGLLPDGAARPGLAGRRRSPASTSSTARCRPWPRPISSTSSPTRPSRTWGWSCWARPRSPRRGSTAPCSRCSPTAS